MVNDLWKREFRASFLRVEHHKPHQFVSCVWQRNQEVHWAYILFRVFMSVVFSLVIISSLFDIGRTDTPTLVIKWPIYLTNWGSLLCFLQFVLGTAMAIQQFSLEKRHGKYIPVKKKLSFLYQFYWVLNTIALVLSIGISSCYWGTVYNPKTDNVDAINVFVHAGNALCMLIDFSLAAHPFRLLHCYWSFLFTAVYILFNFIYYELGGTDRNNKIYIYPLMNWSKPRESLLCVTFGLIFILFVHCVVWVFYVLKCWLIGLCMKNDTELFDDYHHSKREMIPMDVVV